MACRPQSGVGSPRICISPSDHREPCPSARRVPFFTGQSSGVYQSIYVVLPATAHVVEILGDFYIDQLPPQHIRFSSTDQFCSPKRRKLVSALRTPLYVATDPSPWLDTEARAGPEGRGAAPLGPPAPALAPHSLGVDRQPGDADLNKTTMAGADPEAAIAFAARYLGGAPIQQHRGPMADGPCTKLAWAEWPDRHQWHVVRYDTADWVTLDGLRPTVPFNISDLATYIERLRDLTHGTYDQWLDVREVLEVGNLTAMAELFRRDAVPFGVWARPAEGTCSLYLNVPLNGIAVEITSRVFDGAWLARRCAASPFDLCAAD